jgi:hypothetical protein
MRNLRGYDDWIDKVSYENTVCARCDDDVGDPDKLDDENQCRQCRPEDE